MFRLKRVTVAQSVLFIFRFSLFKLKVCVISIDRNTRAMYVFNEFRKEERNICKQYVYIYLVYDLARVIQIHMQTIPKQIAKKEKEN